MAFSNFLEEIANYFFNVADNGGSLHEPSYCLIDKRILCGSNQLYTIGPLAEQFSYKCHGGSLFTTRQIVRIYIEDHILKEVVKSKPFGIHIGSQKLCQHFRLENDFFNKVHNCTVIPLENGIELVHLNKIKLLLGNFSLKS